LTPSTSKNFETGQMNGVKNSTKSFSNLANNLASFLRAPFVLIFSLCRLYYKMGWSFLPGLLLLIITFIVDKSLHKYIDKLIRDEEKEHEGMRK